MFETQTNRLSCSTGLTMRNFLPLQGQVENDTKLIVCTYTCHISMHSCQLCLDGCHAITRRGHLLCLLIWDLNVELFLDCHDQLNGIETVSTQVLSETGARCHLFFV